jgi:GAF domain-containing protein
MSSRPLALQTKKVRRYELVEMLNEVALAASEHLDVQQILESELDIVVERLGMESGTVFLWGEDDKLVLKTWRGLSESNVQEIERRREKRGERDPAGQAARSGKECFVSDMAQDSRFEGIWEVRENRSHIQIPLIARAGIKGVMGWSFL